MTSPRKIETMTKKKDKKEVAGKLVVSENKNEIVWMQACYVRKVYLTLTLQTDKFCDAIRL